VRRIVFVVVLASLATGCVTDGWDDVPNAQVRPESRDPAVSGAQWRAEVTAAVDEWAALLAERGCEAPFVVSTDSVGDHPVRLIANADWDGDKVDGRTWSDAPTQPPGSIEIRGGMGRPGKEISWRRDVLMHELGHALGLGHADRELAFSIMTPTFSTSEVTADDVSAAACELGCGPCDATADTYEN
jgi:hypothetical protein